MAWYKFWARGGGVEGGKKGAGESVDVHFLNVDFFCQLTYMAAIATSGIARSGLFFRASKLPYVSARYFQKVDFVAKAFNHDYSEACRIVGQATKEPEVKAVLLRLSGALASGEDIATFLEREAEIASETYGNYYERNLEVLRKWTDAYIALIMTSAIVTVMAVVTMIMGNVTTSFILGLSTLTVVVTIAGVWLIYRAAPREIKVHSGPVRSSEQQLARNVAPLTLVVGGLAIVALLMTLGIGWALLAAGVFLFPLGLIAKINDSKVDKRDTDIAGFLRSLGGVSQAVGATVSEAMGRLDFRSLGSLKDDVTLLYNRLTAGITPHLCWERFVGESGSEQVKRSVRIFWDAVTLGGEPERVGVDVSAFAMKISLLRAKRGLIVSGMSWLSIAMHAVLALLIIFVYQTLITFSGLVQAVMPDGGSASVVPSVASFGIYSSSASELDLMYFMVVVIIIALTIANAFAIHVTSGGHIYKLAFYLAMTAAMSGLAFIVVPEVVGMMFGGIG